MASSSDPTAVPIRRPSIASRRSNSVPFPSSPSDTQLKESESTSSALTSSDKLSALPSQSPPVFERLRTPSRAIRRSNDASSSSIDSPSSSLPALQSFHSITGAAPSRLGESDSSVGHDTPRQRNESESSLPATLQSIKRDDAYSRHPLTHPARIRSLSGHTSVTGRLAQHSDSAVPSPSLRSREGSTHGGHITSQQQLVPNHQCERCISDPTLALSRSITSRLSPAHPPGLEPTP
ncbi:hypothetical protein C8Q70DRAFT_437719 [Cubamyces menziesii]|nr:hypothetical protein C8Q70DRAFT_437719 [Cubamyces menziesii]